MTDAETQANPATTNGSEAPANADNETITNDTATADAGKGTIAAEGVDKQASSPATWPENWRDLVAKDNKKERAQLERFDSPESMWKSYRAIEQKKSSGELKSALAKDATPEQVAEWRKENGLPDKPEAYDLTMPDGLIIGENDKPMINEYLKTAHATNQHPDQVKANVEWFLKANAQAQADIEAQDTERWTGVEEELRAEWGADYAKNKNLITGLLDTAPQNIKDQLIAARLPDGTKLGGNPDALRFLVSLAREINPIGTLVPGASGTGVAAIEDEMANLQKMMGDHNSEYWKGPKSEKLQARYRELDTAQKKLKSRAA